MKKTRNITLTALIISIAFIFLYMSGVVPSGKLACLCVATACICIIVLECGKKAGFLSGVILSVLGYLFLPDKFIALTFIIFFSYYPLVKLLFEKSRSIIKEWIYKGIYFLTIISVFLILMHFVFPSYIDDFGMALALVGAGVVFFGVFDYALSILIGIYIRKIMPITQKNR